MLIAPFQRDPTQTLTLRQNFRREFNKRWNHIRRIVKESFQRDALAIKRGVSPFQEATPLSPDPRVTITDQQRLDRFTAWFEQAMRQDILGQTNITGANGRVQNDGWMDRFITSAYLAGLRRANAQMRAAGMDVPEITERTLQQPQHQQQIAQMKTRYYSDLAGIISVVVAQSQRELSNALSEGKSNAEITALINDRVDSIGKVRSNVLVMDSVVRTFNLALLARYAQENIERVTATVEFTTAGDSRVCPICRDLSGRIYTIQEAVGVIPVHGGCRCSWSPVL